MSYTPNLNLKLTPQVTDETFGQWRSDMSGETDSNMTKIDQAVGRMDIELTALKSLQHKVYGVIFKGSNPAGTRLDDAVGLNAAVGVDSQIVTNDFDNLYPWSGIRRCNGYYNDNADFVVTAYEGEPEYATDGSHGNVWVEVPLFYLREEFGRANVTVVDEETSEESEIEVPTESLYITPYEMQGYRLPEKFKKLNGDIRPKIYIAAYTAGISNNVPVSYAGMDSSAPLWSYNSFMAACKEIGDGYCAYTPEDFEILSTLFLVEFATRDSQSVMRGVVDLTTTGVNIEEDVTDKNYVVIDEDDEIMVVGRPVKIHASANNAAGEYHDITQIVPYYASVGDAEYNSTTTYYTRSGDSEPYTYTEYTVTYDEETWAETAANLYVATNYKKVIFEDNASVTATAGMKLYQCPFKTGYTDNIVASSGAYRANDGCYPIKYRGIENPWGNIRQFMSGILINNKVPYIRKDASTMPSNPSTAAIVTNNMSPVGYTLAGNGYISELGYDPDNPMVRLPVAVDGSETTYYCDRNYSSSGVRVLHAGGSCSYGSHAGLFYFYLNNTVSTSSWALSSRLSYTG